MGSEQFDRRIRLPRLEIKLNNAQASLLNIRRTIQSQKRQPLSKVESIQPFTSPIDLQRSYDLSVYVIEQLLGYTIGGS